jgi:hypothetical protein
MFLTWRYFFALIFLKIIKNQNLTALGRGGVRKALREAKTVKKEIDNQMQKSSNLHALLFLLFVSTLLLFSAKKIPTKEELIQLTVAEKLTVFQQKEKEKCRQKILEKAGILVDSMLIARARMQVDEKPEIPFRPDRPEVKVPKDSMPVRPLFPEGKIINTPKGK